MPETSHLHRKELYLAGFGDCKFKWFSTGSMKVTSWLPHSPADSNGRNIHGNKEVIMSQTQAEWMGKARLAPFLTTVSQSSEGLTERSHAPNDVRTSHKAPPLKSSTTSQWHHLEVEAFST
jgi:hypothetical protein